MRPSFGLGVLVFTSTVVLGGVVAGSGCTVLTNDALPDDAGKFDGETDASSPTCAACLGQECVGQWATCLTDPACAAIAKRGDVAACVAPEVDGGADPVAVYGAFTACNGTKTASGGACASDCTASSLPSPCATGDGGVDASNDGAASDAGADDADAGETDAAADADAGTMTPVNPAAACASCISGACGDAKKACAIGSECAAYLECAFAADDVAATEECGRQHATGKSAAVELATCTRVGCSDACGF
jgi:hypothetical protein